MRPVNPPLDPLAHKAAIDAIEGQRAAYRRFARNLDAQRSALTDGDADRATAAVEDAARGFDTLDAGAQRLRPLLGRAREAAGPDELREIQQRVAELMHEARSAETAIQNLTTQLEVWRDAYGKQLAELGVVPGGEGAEPAADPSRRAGPYARPGFGPGAQGPGSHLLDRKA